MKVRFVWVCEGTSDMAFRPHLEELCIRVGADEAIGLAPDLSRMRPPPGRSVGDQLAAIRHLDLAPDFVCVHRDADRDGLAARQREIAAFAVGFGVPVVPVIPVRALEAWLLLDGDAIRAAVGVPRGRGRLQLPSPSQVESLPDPKRTLEELLIAASGATGRRLRQVKKDFNANRRFLVERLDLDGPVQQLSGWQALVAALTEVIAALGASAGSQQPPRR